MILRTAQLTIGEKRGSVISRRSTSMRISRQDRASGRSGSKARRARSGCWADARRDEAIWRPAAQPPSMRTATVESKVPGRASWDLDIACWAAGIVSQVILQHGTARIVYRVLWWCVVCLIAVLGQASAGLRPTRKGRFSAPDHVPGAVTFWQVHLSQQFTGIGIAVIGKCQSL
jgi:hypothetical protein